MIFKFSSRSIIVVMMAMGLSACGGESSNNAAAVTGSSNAAPVATFVIAEIPEDTPIEFTLPAVDDDDDTLTFSAVSQPENGTVAIVGNKATYTPADNFNGQDSFTFKANDGINDSNTAAVTINIAAVNDTPEAVALSINTNEDIAVEVVLSATDVDNDALTYEVVTLPTSGSLGAVVGNKVIYTPAENINGDDRFSFKVNDGSADSGAAEATITVVPVNDAPLAEVVNVKTDEGTVVEVALKASDVDSDSLVYSIVDQPQGGLLSSVIGNTVTYTPVAAFSGVESFTYRANDGEKDSEVMSVSVAMGNIVAPIVQLTDTGITLCSNGDGVESSCPVGNYPDQDAQYGRDVDNNDDSDGHAGFSYIKLDANGKDLPASADSWSCVKDNVTGLIWEVKQDENGIVGENLHDSDDRYTWYSTDNNTNNGFVGFQRYQPIGYDDYYQACYGYDSAIPSSYCNTEAFVDRVNQAGLCGANDWRLPSVEALRSLTNYPPTGHSQLRIDRDYFPQTQGYFYRSSSSYAADSYSAWNVIYVEYNYNDGRISTANGKSNDFYVRLVRGGIDRR